MLRVFAVILSFTSELFTGHSFSSLPGQTLSRHDQLQQPLRADVPEHHDWVKPMRAATPLNGVKIGSRKDWIVTCDSEEDEEHNCGKTIDGDGSTFWLANRTSSTQPSVITVDLSETQNVSGIAVEPRQDGSIVGNVVAHEIYLSSDGKHWAYSVAYGTWWSDRTEKYSSFETVPARYVRLVVLSDATSSSLTAIAEFNVYTNPSYTGSRPDGNVGKWGPTINTPIVPVTGFVDPLSHKVVLISSKRHDNFAQDRPDYTLTALWDPISETLTQATVENTNHNMFCPGTCFDAEGRMVVSGGSTGTVTSIFDGSAKDGKQWQSGADLVYTRGYHAAVLNADGRMFVMGGSWGDAALDEPEQFIKNGEIYDPKADEWTLLPKCQAQKMMTKDREYYRRDNHAWLFTWKNDTVFHAGPSKNMNWYTLTGKGGWQTAGTRTPSDGVTDDDAMNGQAIMYDAMQGRILTFGGAYDYYKGGPSSDKVFDLTLGEPNGTVHVERVESLGHARTFATAVVVPTGDVLVAGGQGGIPIVFNDQNPVLQVEMYSPKTGHWTQLASNSIVRVYHSITLLLPDATIISGGSGLCGDSCEVNHFDVQIYTPPYLLRSDGQLAPRPSIVNTSATEVQPGGTITITTDSDVVDASLIRYSATTHTVNNDQRRIPLDLVNAGDLEYQVRVPHEGYVAIPGYWMLFVMDAEGVPSVAETIKILIE